MKIKSLRINYQGQPIISDIDDCLIKTSKLLRNKRINKRYMFYGYNMRIFEQVEITAWGKELKEIIKDYPVTLWTAGKNRMHILKELFNTDNIIEGMSDDDKISRLQNINEDVLYVDNKRLKGIHNNKVKYIIYKSK